ncbi:MAG TPA: hypothetical protein VHC98_03410 [Candidatus Saccharimonadales bacterium]|nr:hypothetical protein [Candidatus Saccharimonadales bacterium]
MRVNIFRKVWGVRVVLAVFALTLVGALAAPVTKAPTPVSALDTNHAEWLDKTHILLFNGKTYTYQSNAGAGVATFTSPGACSNAPDMLVVPSSTDTAAEDAWQNAGRKNGTLYQYATEVTLEPISSSCTQQQPTIGITLDNSYNDAPTKAPAPAKWTDSTTVSYNGDTFKLDGINNHEATLTDTKVTNCTLGGIGAGGQKINQTPDTLKIGDNTAGVDYQVATYGTFSTFKQTSGSTPCAATSGDIQVIPFSNNFGYTGTWKDGTTITVDNLSGEFDQIATNGDSMTLQHAQIQSDQNADCVEQNNNSVTSHFDQIVVNPFQTARTGSITIWTTVNPASGVSICTSQTLQIRLTNTNPDSCTGDSCTSNNTPQATDNCNADQKDAFRWVECPVFDTSYGILGAINDMIGGLLAIPIDTFFSPSFEGAFNKFRDVGVALLVIAGLVMVVSQAADLEFLSAHTVRKALPRIVIAAIGMSLAWPLLEFVITFFNDIGNWVGQIILLVTQTSSNGAGGVIGAIIGGIGGSIVAFLGTAAIVGTLTFGGVLALIASAILFILVGLAVLAIRWLVVLICILMAPLAIASYILPGTEKIWKFWKDTLLTTLLMYPIIMAFLASGAALSSITLNSGNFLMGVLSVFLYIVPYLAIPFAFKMAGGLMTQIIQTVEGQHRKTQGGLAGYRANERKWKQEQINEGRRNVSGLGRVGQWWTRRTTTPGGLSMGFGKNSQWAALQQKQRGLMGSHILEGDKGFMSGDDDANGIAQYATSEADFIRRHSALLMSRDATLTQAAANARSTETARMLQASYGAALGSEAMQVAAWKAKIVSPTGYAGDDLGYAQMVEDGRRLVTSGVISGTDAANTVKANAKRADMSATSWPALYSAFTNRNNFMDNTGAISAYGQQQINEMRNGALDGATPGQLVAGRPEAVRALAPHMVRRINELATKMQQAQAGTQERLDAERDYKQGLAKIAGVYDVMSQISPQNAGIMAQGVMSQPVDGRSIRELIENFRSDPSFLEVRREIGAQANQYAQQQQNAANAASGGTPGQLPQIGP